MNYEIKSLVTGLEISRNITIVTVSNMPNKTEALQMLFSCFAKNGINIDMISLCPSPGLAHTISFTAQDDDLAKILNAIGTFKTIFLGIRSDVQANHCKITFSGGEINKHCGVAAYIFEAFAKHDTEISLVTTSETQISCLISAAAEKNLKDILENEFDLKEV